MKISTPEYVRNITECLENAGYEAYIVGGCVRDSLLGKKPDDHDVTTSAFPQEVKKVLSGYKVIETGIKHGTVTAVSSGKPVEITTFRCDGSYSDHRRPDSVRLTRSLAEDLARRDFTINAMAYSHKTGIVDLYGGKKDLEDGIIRCVGEPERRFDEDALRIMRAIRFSAVLDFEIEEKTRLAIHKLYPLLSYVSEERIAAELKKLLCGKGKSVARVLTEFSDVFCHLIPEFKPAIGLDQRTKWHIYDVYTHTVKVVENSPPILAVRLAALFHDIAKPKMMFVDENGVGHFWGHPEESAKMTREILRRLKFDNATVDRVCRLIEIHDVRPEANKKAVRRYLAKYAGINTDEIMALRRADIAGQNPHITGRFETLDEIERIIREIESEGECLTVTNLDISGNDIISLGARGESVGRILRKLLEDVVEERIENSKEKLLPRAKQLWDSMK